MIAAVRHDARLDAKQKDGYTARESLAGAAKRGDAWARAQLQGPESPEELDYLRDWAEELHGRSGIGMGGVAMLNPSVVESWARLKGIHLEPYEFDTLLILDAVLGNPGTPDDDTNAERRRG